MSGAEERRDAFMFLKAAKPSVSWAPVPSIGDPERRDGYWWKASPHGPSGTGLHGRSSATGTTRPGSVFLSQAASSQRLAQLHPGQAFSM